VNARTCKHLRAVLGDAYEDARLKLKDPDGDHSASGAKKKAAPKKKAAAKKKKKAADGDEDEEEEDEDEDGGKVKVELLLAGKWDLATGADPTDWWMSEKLDGVRSARFLLSDGSAAHITQHVLGRHTYAQPAREPVHASAVVQR
jgi:DNA ligase-1